jgi:transcription elongation factor
MHGGRIARIFSIPSMPGRAYIEAKCRADVAAAFPENRLIFRVPFEESISLTSWIDRIRSNALQKGSWVRFRRGRLKGRLGAIVETKAGTDSVTVMTLSCEPAEPKATLGERGRLCAHQIQATHAVTIVPHPQIEEILPFYNSGSLEFASFIKQALHRESVRAAWQVGDRVKVLGGAFMTLEGRLKSLDLELWSAEVELQDAGGSTSISQVPLGLLRRRFFVGSEVHVFAGLSKGRRGIVVSADDESVIFIEDKTREEVRLLSMQLLTASN